MRARRAARTHGPGNPADRSARRRTALADVLGSAPEVARVLLERHAARAPMAAGGRGRLRSGPAQFRQLLATVFQLRLVATTPLLRVGGASASLERPRPLRA
ncbi:hypothetical protein STENM223S_02448 [Streptomyces tendae]